ncbi:plasmid mobilization relaxosome protein MobC [Bradyrhizobium betae]|uniref:plasmid mobilization relaxosome protein MobC n=1 Tax=Bradyrhizobium betae TaxID=244734 RepID=UPI003D67897E
MNHKTEKAKPFSLRLTQQEKDRLQADAGGTPLGIYIRARLLEGDAAPRDESRQYPIKDAEPLGRLLGLLGQSRITNNLNQLAKASNQGSLPVTKEVESELQQACVHVSEMRMLLLKALGIRVLDQVRTTLPVVDYFNPAARGEP